MEQKKNYTLPIIMMFFALRNDLIRDGGFRIRWA